MSSDNMKVFYCCIGFKAEELENDTSAVMFFAAATKDKSDFLSVIGEILNEWEYDPIFIEDILPLQEAIAMGKCSEVHQKSIKNTKLLSETSKDVTRYWCSDAERYADPEED